MLSTTLTSPVTTPRLDDQRGARPVQLVDRSRSALPGRHLYRITATTSPAARRRAGTYATGTTVAGRQRPGQLRDLVGTLVNVPANPKWKWQWQLTARPRQEPDRAHCCGRRQDGHSRRAGRHPGQHVRASGTTATDWIYGLNDVTFGQSVNVAAPVYAGHDLILANTATIAETIPASLTLPARPNRIAVGHDLSLVNPQNQVGHVDGSRPGERLAEIHVIH